MRFTNFRKYTGFLLLLFMVSLVCAGPECIPSSVMCPFLQSTSLAQARTRLGVNSGTNGGTNMFFYDTTIFTNSAGGSQKTTISSNAITTSLLVSDSAYTMARNFMVNGSLTRAWPSLPTLSTGKCQIYILYTALTVTNFTSSGTFTNQVFFRDDNGSNSFESINQTVTALGQYVSAIPFAATNASPFTNRVFYGGGTFGGRLRMSIQGVGANIEEVIE